MRIQSGLFLVCLATVLWTGAALAAADTSFGLQAGVLMPTGDLAKLTGDSVGMSIGAHLLVDLGGGHTVRPRLDFASFPGQTGYFKFQSFSGGADYVYFTQAKLNQGYYLVAGAGIAANSYETFEPLYSRSYNNPYLALGAGYQFNARIGLEFRYLSSRFTDALGGTSSVNSLGLNGTFRF